MIKFLSINHHYITHLQFAIVWMLLVLKMSDYWVQTGEGSEILPEKWVYFSQTFDQTYQNLLTYSGLGISLFVSYTKINQQSLSFWNVVFCLLWLMMLFSSIPLTAAAVSFSLSLASSFYIISQLLKQRLKKSRYMSIKIKPQSSTTSFNPSVSNPPCDLDLSKLDIGTTRKTVSSSISPAQLQAFAKPRPVISPSRFSSSSIMSSQGNLTKASWVAGGYWQSNKWPSTPAFSSPSPSQNTPLTRSSSQSSGFGSVQTSFLNRSPPDSRPDSTLEDIDRFSVFSDNNVDTRFSDSSLRFPDSSPNSYPYTNELSPKSMLSSISTMNGSAHHISANTLTHQWSWLPFMFGFSLAVNVCVLSYFVLLHHSQVGSASKFPS